MDCQKYAVFLVDRDQSLEVEKPVSLDIPDSYPFVQLGHYEGNLKNHQKRNRCYTYIHTYKCMVLLRGHGHTPFQAMCTLASDSPKSWVLESKIISFHPTYCSVYHHYCLQTQITRPRTIPLPFKLGLRMGWHPLHHHLNSKHPICLCFEDPKLHGFLFSSTEPWWAGLTLLESLTNLQAVCLKKYPLPTKLGLSF